MSVLASANGLLEGARPSGASSFDRIDPAARLVTALAFALAVVSIERLPVVAGAIGLGLAMCILARAPFRPTVKRLLALDGFMLFVLAMLPFTQPGEMLFCLGSLPASREGVTQALLILGKSNAVVLAITALLGTLDATKLGQAMGRLGLPAKFVHLFLFTVRYLNVLAREFQRLRTAMAARGFAPGFNRHTWRSYGYLFGMLLVRSLERSERISAAMRCRGFDGSLPPFARTEPAPVRGRAFATLSMLACIALVTLEHV